MRKGNYMTAERVLALATAGYNIRQFYLKVEAEIIEFRSVAIDGMVSLDTLQEILNRCRPRQDDIDRIGLEKKFFEDHKVRREKSRDYRRFQREAIAERDFFADDSRALDFSNDPNPFPSTPALPGSGASSHAERGATPPAQPADNRELFELHAELVTAFGSGTFINADQAMMLLQVEQPTIDALVNNDYLRLSTLPGRYLIAEI